MTIGDADQTAATSVSPSPGAGSKVLTHLAIFGGLLVLWECAGAAGITNQLLFPSPSSIVRSIARIYFVQGNIWWPLWVTTSEVLAGFVVGSLFGMGLAVAVGLSKTFRRYLTPYIIIMEATPRIAMGPLLLAWLGFGFSSKLAIITLVCFFAPFINTLSGILTVDEDRMELMRSLRASKSQIFRKLMLPAATPMIMAGLRLAMASALGGALVAEFISANQGMGVILNLYARSVNMPSAFATLLTLTAVGFLLYRIMETAEGRIIFWQHPEQMQRAVSRRAAAWRDR